MAIKILLDAGHGQGSAHNRGYVGTKWKNEGDGNYYYSLILKKELESYGFIVGLTRNKISDNPSLSARGSMAKGYDLFISLHTNAGGGVGVEIYEDVKARFTSLATNLCKIISSTLSTTNRGVKYRYSGNANWYGVLGSNKAKAGMLIEHCFHDNATDVKKYEDRANTLAKNMAKTIAQSYGITTSSTTNSSTSTESTKDNVKEDIDIMDRANMFLVAYTESTDMDLLKKVVNNYFMQRGSQFVLSLSGKFDYTGLNDRTIINVGGEKVSKSAFSKIPQTQYFVMNDEEANILISGQKNWAKLKG